MHRQLFLCCFTTFIIVTIYNSDISCQSYNNNEISHHNPSSKKALLLSAVCPGLGQIYNGKYWKLPLIYGAGSAFAYSLSYNQLKHAKFKKALFEGKENAVIDGRIYGNIKGGVELYGRYRDISIIGLASVYFLNIIDAMIDAHFYYYDVSDDLSLNIRPAVINNHEAGLPGISVSLCF